MRKEKPPEQPLYRLTITGTAATMHQVSEAFELQGRLHLGQIDEVYTEIDFGVHTAGIDQNLPVGSVAEGEPGRWGSDARFDALMNFRDAVKPLLRKAEDIWREYTHRGPLEALRVWGNRREKVAYGLWKHLEHRLLHIHLGGKEADSWTRMTVHYPTPSGIAEGVTLTLEPTGTGTREATITANTANVSARGVDRPDLAPLRPDAEPVRAGQELSGTEFFRECLGVSSYRPVKIGKYEASNPATIRRVFEEACRNAPKVADVIAALVFWEGASRNAQQMQAEIALSSKSQVKEVKEDERQPERSATATDTPHDSLRP